MKLWEKALLQGQAALSEEILKILIEGKGVRSFCAAPGARAAPLVRALSAFPAEKLSPPLQTLFFFDERSAAFFALGRAKRDQRPAAVITTSGTAVAELLPAVCEANLCGLPLALLTSDRPQRERRALAPQTLKNPLQIFSGEAACSLELSLKDLPFFSKAWERRLRRDFRSAPFPSFFSERKASTVEKSPAERLKAWDPSQGSLHINIASEDGAANPAERLRAWDPSQGSLHINIAFEEPLAGGPFPSKALKLSQKALLRKPRARLAPPPSALFYEDLKKFLSASKKPLLLIGELSDEEAKMAAPLLSRFEGAFYTDPLSQLQRLKGALKSGEAVLSYGAKSGAFDGVIRLGGLPRVRFWRDLERLALPVLSLSPPPYRSGLGRASALHPLSAESLARALSQISWKALRFKAFDRKKALRLQGILQALPQSEAALMAALQKALPQRAHVFLGNSLPIRLWDKVWGFSEKRLKVTGQNGANGIDGLISRFLGEIPSGAAAPQTAILGDLSALYDFQGLFAAPKKPSWRIFIINNFGGRIFSRALPDLPLLVNAHSLSFRPFAEMWGLRYSLCNKDRPFSPKDRAQVVEIQPDLHETEKFFQAESALWQ